MDAKTCFSEKEKVAILQAISEAEEKTTGEIRLHVEDYSRQEPMVRAKAVFTTLNMHQTEAHNGVLFYIAVKDHQLAVFADEGICAVVPSDFWHQIIAGMKSYFVKSDFLGGVIFGIEQAGNQLAKYFPKTENNKNELSNDISFG